MPWQEKNTLETPSLPPALVLGVSASFVERIRPRSPAVSGRWRSSTHLGQKATGEPVNVESELPPEAADLAGQGRQRVQGSRRVFSEVGFVHLGMFSEI